MESAEAEGTSIDDAIERALQRLGVSRDRVDIEIISNSTRGLFGLGGRRAKVRATLRRPLTLTPDPPAAPAPAPPRAAPATPPRSDTAAPQREARRQEDRSAPRREPRPKSTSAAPRRAASAPRPDTEARPRPPLPPLDDASIERARSGLAEIVRLTGSEGRVEVAQDGDSVRLVILGDPSGTLIGRRGQTLDALEHIVNRIVSHQDESISRLVVDLEDYRLRRRQALEAMAQRVAERARKRGKPVTLNPMSPRDRRIVHLALQGDPTLTTRSAGSGFYRKVVIVPAEARRGRSRPTETP